MISLPLMSTSTAGMMRHRQQRADELRAEPRERRRLPLLDPELEQVARQHEDQRDQQRQVDGEQRVEQHVA